MNKLCKASKKINQSELYEHLTKLLGQSTIDTDTDMKIAHKLTAKKTIKQLKLEDGENEEDISSSSSFNFLCTNYVIFYCSCVFIYFLKI